MDNPFVPAPSIHAVPDDEETLPPEFSSLDEFGSFEDAVVVAAPLDAPPDPQGETDPTVPTEPWVAAEPITDPEPEFDPYARQAEFVPGTPYEVGDRLTDDRGEEVAPAVAPEPGWEMEEVHLPGFEPPEPELPAADVEPEHVPADEVPEHQPSALLGRKLATVNHEDFRWEAPPVEATTPGRPPVWPGILKRLATRPGEWAMIRKDIAKGNRLSRLRALAKDQDIDIQTATYPIAEGSDKVNVWARIVRIGDELYGEDEDEVAS